MGLKYLGLIFFIFIKLIVYIPLSFGLTEDDCKNSPFYIKNIKVDLTKTSINEARSEAELKIKLLGFKRLMKRLIVNENEIKINNSVVSNLVSYFKINNEANSDTRYLADFDICFNRLSVINYFRENKILYSETFRDSISVLPVFKGLRGFVMLDENDSWFQKWKKELELNDGLVKLELVKGNFYLNRNLTSNLFSNTNQKLIQKLIINEETNALLVVLAEPVLKTDGKTYLSTFAKFYNDDGNLENTIYRNLIPIKRTSSIYNIDENLLNQEVLKIINSIQNNWKKNNLINTLITESVDLIIPINKLVSTNTIKEFLFNDKVLNVTSTEKFLDRGLIKIENEIIYYNQKSMTSFNELSRSLFGSSKKLRYKSDVQVKQKDISIWPSILKELESLPFVLEVNVISLSNSSGRIIVKFMGDKKTFFQAANEKKIVFKDYNSAQYILVKK